MKQLKIRAQNTRLSRLTKRDFEEKLYLQRIVNNKSAINLSTIVNKNGYILEYVPIISRTPEEMFQ